MTTGRRIYSRLIFPYILILFLSEAWIFDIEFMFCPLNHCSMVNILSISVSIRYSIRHLCIKYMFPIHIFWTFLTGKVRWSVHQSIQWCSGNHVLYKLCRKTININSTITFYLLHFYTDVHVEVGFDKQLFFYAHHYCTWRQNSIFVSITTDMWIVSYAHS